ncbi:MAG: hypothetical protein E8D48_11805 [Nitrospira sp.]|nr:MAG: hypothetical protein E8D48_11805 [Nitrospira sp.]
MVYGNPVAIVIRKTIACLFRVGATNFDVLSVVQLPVWRTRVTACSTRHSMEMMFRELIRPVVEIQQCPKPEVLASVIDAKPKIELG